MVESDETLIALKNICSGMSGCAYASPSEARRATWKSPRKHGRTRTMTTRKTWSTSLPDLDKATASQVDLMFREADDRMYETRTNPVTGGRWVRGLDPIKRQKQDAYRALKAREWFAVTAPHDAPPLP